MDQIELNICLKHIRALEANEREQLSVDHIFGRHVFLSFPIADLSSYNMKDSFISSFKYHLSLVGEPSILYSINF